MTKYATVRELAELTGWSISGARERCKRAKIPYYQDEIKRYYFDRKKALAVLHVPDTASTYIVPEGYISLPELAELAEMCKTGVAYRLKKAGVTPKRIPRACKPGGKAGGHSMLVYPYREALYAVLE